MDAGVLSPAEYEQIKKGLIESATTCSQDDEDD